MCNNYLRERQTRGSVTGVDDAQIMRHIQLLLDKAYLIFGSRVQYSNEIQNTEYALLCNHPLIHSYLENHSSQSETPLILLPDMRIHISNFESFQSSLLSSPSTNSYMCRASMICRVNILPQRAVHVHYLHVQDAPCGTIYISDYKQYSVYRDYI